MKIKMVQNQLGLKQEIELGEFRAGINI